MKMIGFVIMKALVNFMCCFVPSKKQRKAIRRRFISDPARHKELLTLGFKIENDILTTNIGVKMDISITKDHPLYMIKEVFVKTDYELNFTKDAILFDVGMNRGAASLLFATYPNIKRIYSFEPFKPTFEQALKNFELNPKLKEKITAFNYGLGKEDTTLELPYLEDATGAMSTTHSGLNSENIRKETVTVKDAAKTLAPIFEENKDKYVVIKCDCEGAEFEIFERLNQQKLFGRIDIIVMEYHFEKPDGLIDILTQNCFVVRKRIGSSKSRTGYIYAVKMAERGFQ